MTERQHTATRPAPIKVGVVGCGDVAELVYLPGLAHLQRRGAVELTAVADMVPGRATDVAGRYGVPASFETHEPLLGTDVDLVVNLTPMQAHAAVTRDAVGAGKHVYTEKPLAVDPDDAAAIIEEADRGGVVVACAPALLCHPDVERAIRWLRSGVIGRVCFARARGSNPGPDRLPDFRTDPRWFYRPGAGPLLDLGVYPLHVLTAALGPVERVTAFSGVAVPDRTARYGTAAGAPIEVQVDDNTHVMLDFGEATFAYVDATYCVLSSKGPRMEFYGETGVMNLASTEAEPAIEIFRDDARAELRGWTTPEDIYRGRVWPPMRHLADAEPFSAVAGIEHMIAYIRGHADELLVAPDHAHHVLDVMVAAQQSARDGRAIRVASSFSPPFGAPRPSRAPTTSDNPTSRRGST